MEWTYEDLEALTSAVAKVQRVRAQCTIGEAMNGAPSKAQVRRHQEAEGELLLIMTGLVRQGNEGTALRALYDKMQRVSRTAR